MTKHLVIFDTQVKPQKTDLRYFRAFGEAILDHRPDVVIFIGDWWDMSSLSTYDKGGSLKAVGKNYQADCVAGNDAMALTWLPVDEYNSRKKILKEKQYKPRKVFCMGNHEYRIQKFINDNPTLLGTIGYHNLRLGGFEVYEFLTPVVIDGVQYVHYVKNKNSNYPKASAKATVEQTHMSTVQGHKPGLDVHVSWSSRTGRNVWSIINGSSYIEDEDYRTGGGNDHWRGIAVLDDVIDGDFSPNFISMDKLINDYL